MDRPKPPEAVGSRPKPPEPPVPSEPPVLPELPVPPEGADKQKMIIQKDYETNNILRSQQYFVVPWNPL